MLRHLLTIPLNFTWFKRRLNDVDKRTIILTVEDYLVDFQFFKQNDFKPDSRHVNAD